MIRHSVAAMLCIAASACKVVAQSPNEVATMGCRNGVAREVRVQRPDADSVTIGSAPRVTRSARGELTLNGDGHILAGTERQWLRFSYVCAYRPHSARTAVQLTFVSPDGHK
jgi:hypothetical protein